MAHGQTWPANARGECVRQRQTPEDVPPGGLRSDGALKWTLAAMLATVLGLPFVFRPARGSHELARTARARQADLAEKTLTLISPHWEGVRTEYGRAFSEWTSEKHGHTTRLEWLDLGGTSDALRYIRSEFKRAPDGIGVDLFFGGGVDPFLQLARDGLLAAISLPQDVLDPIPQQFAGIDVYDPDGRWFGAALAGFGIIYNRQVLSALKLPEPTAWADLAQPQYLTWIGSGDPRSSGSVHMAYEIILQAYGWDEGWANIVRMGGNTRNFSRSGSDTPRDTALGEVACALAIDVYAWRQIAEVGSDRMGFCLPEGLTIINPDAIALLKGAPDPALAASFVCFVLSEPGQKLWILKKGAPGGPMEFELDRMSVIPGLARSFGDNAAVPYDPYAWKSGFSYDAQKGSLRWNILNDLLGAAIIDTHRELTQAWRSVKDLPPDRPRVAQLTRPPLAEPELMRLAAEQWGDAEFRARTRSGWAQEAKQRYQQVMRVKR